MHLKRNKVPKVWPLKRKGTKYVARALTSLKNGVPLVVALRDIIKLGKTEKDVRNIINSGKIKLNNKTIKDKSHPINIFDVLSLDEKKLRLVIKNKKFIFEETNKEEKTLKIIGKKTLNKGVQQINLFGGLNYIYKDKVKTGDSALIDFKDNKIKEIIPFKEGCAVIFISGKHIGEEGKVESYGGEKVIIHINNKKINADIKNLMVVK